ncbi:MAG TPA: hypothetical protein VNL73_09555 [Verrucomicrobiae bacterium]|nr:hypothetical protein [Verrucomicrobiae bacterium]
MNWIEKSPHLKISAAAGSAALLLALWTAFSHPGSWEDDAYIFFRYAGNFAAGEGLAFNSGEPSFGITSVLWTLLLGVFTWATGLESLAAAKILCALLFSAGVWIFAGLVQKRTQNPTFAWWAGLLTAACPPLVFSSVSGMEIALNFFLLTVLSASFFLSPQKKYWAGGILAGFLFLTRPENLILLPVWGFLAFLEAEGRGRKILGLFLGFAAVALPWQIFLYSQTGLFLPPTRTGKLLLFLPGQFGVTLEQFVRLGLLERLEIAFRSVAVLFKTKNFLVFGPFLVLTGYFILRGRIVFTRFWLAGSVYFLGLIFMFGFFFPLIKLRYFIHVYPFLIFASVLGCYHLWLDIRTRWPVFARPVWARAGLVFLFLSVPVLGFLTARKFAASTQQQDIRREIGVWLKENTPAEARIALEPIGAVGYHSERFILDLGGLVQPEVWPYMKEGANSNPDSLLAFLERKRVDYVIDYSHHPWAGKVVDVFPGKFELSAKIQSPHPPPGADLYDIFRR